MWWKRTQTKEREEERHETWRKKGQDTEKELT